jgi:hypothetical protein
MERHVCSALVQTDRGTGPTRLRCDIRRANEEDDIKVRARRYSDGNDRRLLKGGTTQVPVVWPLCLRGIRMPEKDAISFIRRNSRGDKATHPSSQAPSHTCTIKILQTRDVNRKETDQCRSNRQRSKPAIQSKQKQILIRHPLPSPSCNGTSTHPY